MRSLFYFGFILCLSYSCSEKSASCGDLQSFFSKVENININKMYGLSINYRGDYKNKEKYLRGVQLNDHNKNRVGLPLNLKSLVQERIAELEPSINSLANHFKIGKVDTLYFLDNLIKQITDDFKSLDIISLNSQLHLGEFIEFKLNNDCIIWYKKEGAKLNSTYRVLFNEAQEIRKNWFIINPDDQCLQ